MANAISAENVASCGELPAGVGAEGGGLWGVNYARNPPTDHASHYNSTLEFFLFF